MAITRGNILRHHDAHPLVLDLLLTKVFGIEWWLWEPETLRQVIPQQFKSGCTELVWNKLQAVRAVHVAPEMVFGEWECFLPVITSLNNIVPDFDVMQLPTPARLYAGVGMLRSLDPDEEISEEIRRFIAWALLSHGIYFAPGELGFVQELLRRPYYICPDCGNVEDVLFDHDGICDSCGRDWYDKIIGRNVKKPNVQFHNRYDEAPIRKRFNQVAQDWDGFQPDDDDEIDVQVCKIASAIEYKAKRDQQFMEQKEALEL